MSGVYWGALMNAPNPGQAFAQSFNEGMERNRQQEQEWVKYIGSLAAWADTPEKWDQAVGYLVQNGYKAAEQFRGKFEMRPILAARAGIRPPESQGTDDITEYKLAVSQGFKGSFMDYQKQKGGPQRPQLVPFTEGGGVAMLDPETGQLRTLVAPNPGDAAPGSPVSSAPLTATNPQTGEKIRFNPQSNAWEPMGDAGGNASGGFRDPLAPL